MLGAGATRSPPPINSCPETAGQVCETYRLPTGAGLIPINVRSRLANAISKIINVPESYPFEDFKRMEDLAYDKGLKGCTMFRPNPVTGTVLSETAAGIEAPHCCVLEREVD